MKYLSLLMLLFVQNLLAGSRDFDGSTGFIEISTSTTLDGDLETSGHTVMGWVWWDSLANDDPAIFAQHEGQKYGLGTETTNNDRPRLRITTSVGTATCADAVNIFSTGKWFHFAGTYDGANIRLYLNGTNIKTCPHTGTMVFTAESMYIGRRQNLNFLNGRIADVRVYNRLLTDFERGEAYNGAILDNPTGKKGHWVLNEIASNPSISDISSVGNSGINKGTTYDQSQPNIYYFGGTQ